MTSSRLQEPPTLALSEAIDKIPSCCPNPNALEPGDILIFDINHNQPKANAHHTVIAQGMFNNQGGHKDAIHAAFVIAINGEKKIAHLRAGGFILDDTNIIKTVTHVYRPRIHQQEIAQEISDYVQKNASELKRKLRWKTITSIFSFFRRLFNAIGIKNENIKKLNTPVVSPEKLPSQDQFISSWSICSKFLAETYAGSCNKLAKDKNHDVRSELMNITVNTLPKTLQAYLYRCSNYEYFIMPQLKIRGRLMSTLKAVIDKEIHRLLQKNDAASIAKEKVLSGRIARFALEEKREEKSEVDPITFDFEQAKALLREIIPILKINTGKNVRTPTSYRHVMDFASSQGLYSHYFEKNLKFNSDNNDLTQQAKAVYRYDDKLALAYSQYRKLGFSDEEARFECAPTLWDWMKINRSRNIVAAVTVAPFLFWSLPYGISRVYKAQKRVEALRSEPIERRLSH